jgi:hypothetical protein
MRQLMKLFCLNIGLSIAGTVACVVLFSLLGWCVNAIANPAALSFIQHGGAVAGEAMSRYHWVQGAFLIAGLITGCVAAQATFLVSPVTDLRQRS